MRVTICEMELSEKAHHVDCGWASCIDGWLKEMICRHPMPGLAESRCFRCFATSVLKILKGKCKGLTYEQCLAQQPQYCTWLLRREKSVASEYQGLVGFLRVRLQASEEAVLANLEETSKGKMSEDKGRLLQAGWICRFTQRRNWCPRQRGCGLNTATEKAATDGYVAMRTGFAGWSIEAKNYARTADGHGSSGTREAMCRFVGSRFQQTLGSPCLTFAEILFGRCAVKTNLLCKWTAWCRLSISKCSRCAVPSSGYVW